MNYWSDKHCHCGVRIYQIMPGFPFMERNNVPHKCEGFVMTEAVKPKVREYFIFNNKVVNEQKCKDDGYALLEKGDVKTVEIHFHKSDVACTERPNQNDECYVIEKGDLT